MPQNVLIVAWLIGGSVAAFFVLRGLLALNARLQGRLGTAAHAPEGDERANGFVQVVGVDDDVPRALPRGVAAVPQLNREESSCA